VEQGAGSGEKESGEQELMSKFPKKRISTKNKNKKVDFLAIFNFSENFDLFPWV
jgi:hypothetical protein